MIKKFCTQQDKKVLEEGLAANSWREKERVDMKVIDKRLL